MANGYSRTAGRPGFHYNDKTHVYKLDGERMTGVTTVLGIAGDKSNLIQWAANQAATQAVLETPQIDWQAFAEDVAKYKKIDTRAANELGKKYPAFETARKRHMNIRDTAADAGTEAHLICELFERGDADALRTGNWTDEGKRRARVYMDWYKENVAKTHFVERPLFSKSHFVGGTPDGGMQMKDGRNLLNDKKFKDYIWDPSAFWQMAAYRLMLEEMAQDTTTPVFIEWKDGSTEEYSSPKEYLATFGDVKWDGAVIIRVGEKDFEEMHASTYEDDREDFLAALRIYRSLGAFKNRVLNVTT